VLRRYRERAIAVYRTDCDAAVTIDGSARIRVPGARARA
jgi:beta-lactamase superfamily II metal-dependent hydrolase